MGVLAEEQAIAIRSWIFGLLLVGFTGLIGGCSTDPATASAGIAADLPLPRDRRGCLPFPGMFTLYTVADPAELGRHHYANDAGPGESETERGIVYTTEAGFLDLAHVRNTADWMRYCTGQLADAIGRRENAAVFHGTNGSLVHVNFHYPTDWDQLASTERRSLSRELALSFGARLAYVLLTWHETATWYGDHTFLFDESRSAFTWDDVVSHVVGVRVADLALRSPALSFDTAMTLGLESELRTLNAVSPDQTAEAVAAVSGLWWTNGRPLKRQTDVGLDTGTITPWLVPDLAFAPGRTARRFAVPVVQTISGRDFSGFCTIRIEPRCAAGDLMRAALPDRPDFFDVGHDLPMIMAEMRRQMTAKYGETVSTPQPTEPRRVRLLQRVNQ